LVPFFVLYIVIPIPFTFRLFSGAFLLKKFSQVAPHLSNKAPQNVNRKIINQKTMVKMVKLLKNPRIILVKTRNDWYVFLILVQRYHKISKFIFPRGIKKFGLLMHKTSLSLPRGRSTPPRLSNSLFTEQLTFALNLF